MGLLLARGQQPRGGDILVDHVGPYRCLGECIACVADPLPTDTLNSKHARRIVELLADLFPDTAPLAAARRVLAVRLVPNLDTW